MMSPRMPRLVRRIAQYAGLAAAMTAFIAPNVARAEEDAFGLYLKDRLNDFADIFRIRGGIPKDGKGYGAKARLTFLAQAGYVNFNGYYGGLERRGWGLAEESRTEGGVSALYGTTVEMYPVSGNEYLMADTPWSIIEDRRILRNLPYWDDGRGDLLGVGAEIATPVLALDLGVYPSEAVDFLAGIFTIDPYNDDHDVVEYYPEKYRTPSVLSEPDLEASTRDKQAALDAQNEALAAEQLAEEVENADETMIVENEEIVVTKRHTPQPLESAINPNEPLSTDELNQIETESEEVEFKGGE